MQINSTNEEETSWIISKTPRTGHIDIQEVHDSLTQSDVKYALGKKTHTKFSFIHYSGLKLRVRNEKLIFLFLNQNIGCWYSKEPSQ